MTWNDETKKFALDSARDGNSASQIAKLLAEKYGITKTRNAVIGVVFRSGQSIGSSHINNSLNGRRIGRMIAARLKSARKEGHAKPAPWLAPEPLPPPCETDTPRISFTDLDERKITVRLSDGTTRIVREHCKFPVLPEPAGPHVKQFCGDQRVMGSPYCGHHSSRAYQPPQPRYFPRAAGRAGAFDRTKAIDELESV
jgi:GcrA cell cycle regulator